jgi:hypothetical protein
VHSGLHDYVYDYDYDYSKGFSATITVVWSSYDRTWFSGPDKQEIFILMLIPVDTVYELPPNTYFTIDPLTQ